MEYWPIYNLKTAKFAYKGSIGTLVSRLMSSVLIRSACHNRVFFMSAFSDQEIVFTHNSVGKRLVLIVPNFVGLIPVWAIH